MITHIVLFKLQDPTETACQEVVSLLRSMEGKIPQLRFLQAGTDVVGSERSYDVALITKFDTLDDLAAYQVHAYHADVVVPAIRQLCLSSVTVDFVAE